MGLIKTGVVGLFIVYIVSLYLRSGKNVVPKLPNTWWGPGEENNDVDKSIRPFKVVFENKVKKILFSFLKNVFNL